MACYLKITPDVAYTVLSDILASSGLAIDEPDQRKVARILRPKNPRCPGVPPMVSIPMENASQTVIEKYREALDFATTPNEQHHFAISNNRDPNALDFWNNQTDLIVNTPVGRFVEIKKTLLQQCSTADEGFKEWGFLKTSLSNYMLEADFLRIQLELFVLKARSILEYIQHFEGTNSEYYGCPAFYQRF
ncbi:uncharacterized protein LOC129776114 [Toxorhynchites rutilus septentrionalis]|uniref:uncharacterized protein LOC129776114 n=1 Tax=Toxorhynchites rutilus septentrionalis TaxID=329112 RepID=UPI00247AF9F2|nr:uncharacterized protein LOC129776114 [Toxorhynchites rutilus septentrionalis]